MRTVKDATAYLLRGILLLLLVIFASGCATTPSEPATPREAIAYAYAAVESAAEGVAIAKRNEIITEAQKQELLDDLQGAHDSVWAAENALRAFEATGDPIDQNAVEFYLNQAETVLRLVEAALDD